MTKNIIALQKGFVNLPQAVGQDNLALAMSIQRQLMTYRYMLSQEAFEMVQYADVADITEFHDSVLIYLKEMTGGKFNFKSLYGNFPVDVMSMTDSQLWYTQMHHYWTTHTFMVGAPKEEAFEHTTYTELQAGSDAKFMSIFTDLCSVGNSLTRQDTAVLKWFATSGLELVFPTVIPFKENLALLAALLPQFTVRTVVDVLRVAVGFSGGDVSLPAVPKVPKRKGKKYDEIMKERAKFKFKLSDAEKTRILKLFESSNLDVRDMKQGSRYNRFVRLAEQLKIDPALYPKTADAFYKLRNQTRRGKLKSKKYTAMPVIRTWHSDVQRAFTRSFEAGLVRLSERPTEFLRKLDYLVRKHPKQVDAIFSTFTKIGLQMSNKALFETYTHFSERTKTVPRSVFIKGARQRTPLPALQPLPANVIQFAKSAIWNTFKDKLATLPELGKCYIDENLKKIPLPTNMRSLSEGLKPIIRGQRIPIGDKQVMRAFVHWNDERGNQDIDLHGYLLGTGRPVQFGFNGLKNTSYGYYSGDVRNRRGACAEYVDIAFDAAIANGFKYYLQVLHNYQDEPFNKLKDCYSGIMTTDEPTKGQTWVPSNVENCYVIDSKELYVLTGAIDLTTKEYIHLDLDWTNEFSNAAKSYDAHQLKTLIDRHVAAPEISVYDLIRAHVEARGTVVGDQAQAENQFLYEDYATSYEKTLLLMGV